MPIGKIQAALHTIHHGKGTGYHPAVIEDRTHGDWTVELEPIWHGAVSAVRNPPSVGRSIVEVDTIGKGDLSVGRGKLVGNVTAFGCRLGEGDVEIHILGKSFRPHKGQL